MFGLRPLRTESAEFLHLDALRFLAAISVVVYHYRNQWTFGSTLGVEFPQFEGLRLAVDLFFIISGMIITHVYAAKVGTRAQVGDFLWRRVARLVPLHWATMLFYVAVGVTYMAIGQTPPDPERYAWSCLPVNALLLNSTGLCPALSFNHVSWSISAEMFCYLAFPFLPMLLRIHRLLPAVIALCGLVVLYAVWLITGSDFTDWTYSGGVLRALPAFMLGVSAYAYRVELTRLPRAGWFLLLAGVLLLAGIALVVSPPLMLPLAYLLPILGLGADARPAAAFIRWLAPWGSLTYGLYMLHPPVRTVLLSVVSRRLLDLSPEGQNVIMLVCALVSVLAAYLSLNWFETPLRRWLQKSRSPKPEPSI